MISKSYFTDGILLVRLFRLCLTPFGLDMKTVLPLLYCRRTSFRPMLSSAFCTCCLLRAWGCTRFTRFRFWRAVIGSGRTGFAVSGSPLARTWGLVYGFWLDSIFAGLPSPKFFVMQLSIIYCVSTKGFFLHLNGSSALVEHRGPIDKYNLSQRWICSLLRIRTKPRRGLVRMRRRLWILRGSPWFPPRRWKPQGAFYR